MPMVSTDALSRKYTPEEVERCLLELALVGGNSNAASERLNEEAGIDISPRLLRLWRGELHARRYQELLSENAREIEETIIAECRETAVLAAMVERAALQLTLEQIKSGKIRDPSAAARNAGATKGVNIDKMLTLSGRPTQIIEQSSPDEMLAALLRDKVFVPVDDGDDNVFELPAEAVTEFVAAPPSPDSLVVSSTMDARRDL
jgi:hypothetical protein